ncbi:hypothetical protein [Arcobacter sp. YIC-310]|uniref:hypothetical protein n=1 Tax=Arcobacter sp. YIC-310 TaxID=3376632 RepID=UPI003C2A5346
MIRKNGLFQYFLIFLGCIGFLIASDNDKNFLKFILSQDWNYIGNIIMDKWEYLKSIEMTTEVNNVNFGSPISIFNFAVFFLAVFKGVITLPAVIFYLLAKFSRTEGGILTRLRLTFDGLIAMKILGLLLIFVVPTLSSYVNSLLI